MKLFLALARAVAPHAYQLGIILLIFGELIVIVDAFGGK